MCRTSKKYSSICESSDFWRQKIWKDFQVKYSGKETKEYYKRLKTIKEYKEHCHKMILNGVVNKNELVLDIFDREYFGDPKDLLVYRFITAKFLAKGAGIPDYYEAIYDRYRLKDFYEELERSSEFTEEEFIIFMKLLDEIKKYANQFQNAYINAMLRGDIPFDVTWEKLCDYEFY